MPATKNFKKRLAEAILANHNRRAMDILNHHPHAINSELDDGQTALHLAVKANNFALVMLLINFPKINLNLENIDGETAVYIASANPKISIEILRQLLLKKANPGIPDIVGETPLTAACWNEDIPKCEMLLKAGSCNLQSICTTYGSTALTNAVTKKQVAIAKLIIVVADIKIINHKNSNGESALFIAAKLGLVEVVAALIEVRGIDFDAFRGIGDGKTAEEIAIANGHKKIATMIQKKKVIIERDTINKNMLKLLLRVDIRGITEDVVASNELKLDMKAYKQNKPGQLVSKYPTYTSYLRTLKKFPDNRTFIEYTHELHKATAEQKSIVVMPAEREEVASRQTWSHVISETYTKNAEWIIKQKMQAAIIERLKKLGFKDNTHVVYQCCINYLKHNSAIVVAFKAGFLKKGIQDFQLLNMFQRNISRASVYTQDRDKAEREMFSYLSADLQKKLFENPAARPKYAALVLLDRNQPVAPVVHYGQSFIVLKEAVKFNSLFSPYDSLDSKAQRGADVKPCTYHHLDILLFQCYDKFLHAIATRVTTGLLPDDFHQQAHTVGKIEKGCYIEVLLPAVDIFNNNCIEHIHIDLTEYNLKAEEAKALGKMGLTVTNSNENPYIQIAKDFMGFVENNDVDNARKYLKVHPSLVHISNRLGFEPLHIAVLNGDNAMAKVLLDHGANINALAPNGKAILHIAIEKKNHDLIALLLAHRDININIRMNIPGDALDGATPIHLACIHDIEIFKLFVKRKADTCACTTSGMTVLMLTPFVDVVNIMLSKPDAAVVNHKNKNGETALIIAASKGEAIKVKTLLKFPNIDAQAKHAKTRLTAAEIARKNKHNYSAALIIHHIDSKQPLEYKANPVNDIDKIKLIILKKIFNNAFNNPLVLQNDFIKNIIGLFKLLEQSANIKNPAEIILGFILFECTNQKLQTRNMFQPPLQHIKKLDHIKSAYIKELKNNHPEVPLLKDLDYINIYKAHKKKEIPQDAVFAHKV